MRTYIDSTENWSTLRLIHLHRTQKLIHRNSSLFPLKKVIATLFPSLKMRKKKSM